MPETGQSYQKMKMCCFLTRRFRHLAPIPNTIFLNVSYQLVILIRAPWPFLQRSFLITLLSTTPHHSPTEPVSEFQVLIVISSQAKLLQLPCIKNDNWEASQRLSNLIQKKGPFQLFSLKNHKFIS